MAAAAFVLRPAGWVKLVAAAGEEAQRADAERVGEETRRELERLREELAHARELQRTGGEQVRVELDAARKEAESLQRKLRSALSDVKRGDAALRKVNAEIDGIRGDAVACGRRREREPAAQGPSRGGGDGAGDLAPRHP